MEKEEPTAAGKDEALTGLDSGENMAENDWLTLLGERIDGESGRGEEER